jgi:hypothetical protein
VTAKIQPFFSSCDLKPCPYSSSNLWSSTQK